MISGIPLIRTYYAPWSGSVLRRPGTTVRASHKKLELPLCNFKNIFVSTRQGFLSSFLKRARRQHVDVLS